MHGVVYLHRLVNGTPLDFAAKLKRFKRLCGGDLKNLIIVMWGEEKQGSVDPIFWPAVAEGAKTIHYHGTVSSTHYILREICKNHQVTAAPSSPGEAGGSERVTRDNPKEEGRHCLPGAAERTWKDAHRNSGQGFLSTLMCKRSKPLGGMQRRD